MPYPGVPASLTKKMESCVSGIMADSEFKPTKGKTKKQSAIAVCKARLVKKKAIVVAKKDMTFSEKEDTVRSAWYEAFGSAQLDTWLSWIYDGYVIVKKGGKKYQVKYRMTKTKVTFVDEDKWVEVDIEFVPIGGGKAKTRGMTPGKRFVVLSPCAKTEPVASVDVERARALVMVPQAVKAVTDTPGRYKAYGVLFGDEDNRDLYKQYFTKDTAFHLDWYGEWPWLYHHGLHPAIRAEKVGTWDDFGVDEVGVFIEGELDGSHRYHEAMEVLLAEEVLFPSSRAVADLVKYEDSGLITEWPIVEVSTTIAPAEYRMTPVSEEAVRAIKSLGGQTMSDKEEPTVKGAEEEPTAAVKEEPTVADPTPVVTEPVVTEPVEPVTDDTNGDEEEVAEAYTLEEVAEEVARSFSFDKVVEAITALDTSLKSLSGRLGEVEDLVVELGKVETVKVKTALETGSWFEGLHVASKSNEPVDDEEAAKIKGAQGQPLAEGEGVWERLQASQPQ